MTAATFQFAGIDHVQLAAPPHREAEARHFYGGLLGWIEIPKPEPLQSRGGVWYSCGSHQVHIGVQDDFSPAVKAHPAFRVNGLAALREHLLRNGIRVIDDDARSAEGIVRFYAADPFGNRIEFLE